MKFVIKSGNPQTPISVGSTLKLFSRPPNDVNRRLGNIAEIKVIMTKTKAIRKTPHVTRLENCDSSFLNSNVLRYP